MFTGFVHHIALLLNISKIVRQSEQLSTAASGYCFTILLFPCHERQEGRWEETYSVPVATLANRM